MSKINLQEPQRNHKFCQFNKDQYCTSYNGLLCTRLTSKQIQILQELLFLKKWINIHIARLLSTGLYWLFIIQLNFDDSKSWGPF